MCHHFILVRMYAFAISYAIFMHLGSEEEITLLEFDEVIRVLMIDALGYKS